MGLKGKKGEGEGIEEETPMKVAILPGLVELRIKVNPAKKVTQEDPPYIVMPWMFAPWPAARSKRRIETEVEGETLRELLNGLSDRYKKAGVDFEPINPKTDDIDFDYDIFVNGQNYVGLSKGLETKLKRGDEVLIKMNWRWDG